ncbi:MAG: ATP-binding cassette domain-containing protein, partial [Chloroflexota bacterium]|nr:ATP-binding cassette domain-containing protein [Chloroflexota bacterium]
VLIDGQDVRDLSLAGLRVGIGAVLQETFLYSVSVRENIAYGRPEASFAEIVAAATAARAHEFIEAMPEGYATIVGERGVTLSGGQRQRLAIARALLLDPRILILDDATSSVDTETEAAIQAALATLMEGRTSFVIAQRLGTVQRADQILVLDAGRIVARGTHHELIAQSGFYQELYASQSRDHVETDTGAKVGLATGAPAP